MFVVSRSGNWLYFLYLLNLYSIYIYIYVLVYIIDKLIVYLNFIGKLFFNVIFWMFIERRFRFFFWNVFNNLIDEL